LAVGQRAETNDLEIMTFVVNSGCHGCAVGAGCWLVPGTGKIASFIAGDKLLRILLRKYSESLIEF
jgi:hypothetical protein